MASVQAENKLRRQLDAKAVSLDQMGLVSLDPLLPSLAGMKHMHSLSLAGNSLCGVPADLSSLQQLSHLNLASNPIPNLASVLPGLRSLPALRHLVIDLPFETEEEELIVALPRLESFNGTSLIGGSDLDDGTPQGHHVDPNTGDTVRATYWTTDDSAKVEHLFADVTEACGNTSKPQEFFDYLGRVVKHVNCLTAADDDPLCQEGEVLKASHLLYEHCFEEMTRAVMRIDPTLGKGLQALVKYNSNLLSAYDTHWRRIFRDRDARLTLMKRDMKEAISQIESLMVQVGGTGLGTSTSASSAAAAAAGGTMGSAVHRNGGGAASRGSYHGSSPAAAAAAPGGVWQTPPQSSRRWAHGGATPSPTAPQRSPSLSRSRVLTLKQLKVVIEELYTSKSKYDAKCRQNGLPRETMEQHMYTYLNQRYGLKEIIENWALGIVQGVKRFAPDDNDVAVFGKILRNDVDEEFRYVQRQVRETVKELIRSQIKTNNRLKSDVQVNELLQKKMEGVLSEDEWTAVVRYMYSEKDAATIVALMRHNVYQQSLPSRRRGQQPSVGKSARGGASSVPYRDLVRTLLDFQLEGHEQFLAPYVSIFRAFDRDQNGIVNDQEFMQICHAIDPSKGQEEIEALVRSVDPLGTQLITFSETVSFLNLELVKLSVRHGQQQGL